MIECDRCEGNPIDPNHVVHRPPVDDDEDDDSEDMTPLEDRSTWPTHEPDMGEPVGYDDARNLNATEIRMMT